MRRFQCLATLLFFTTVFCQVRAADVAPAGPDTWRLSKWVKGEIVLPVGHYRGTSKRIVTERHCDLVVSPGTLIELAGFETENNCDWKFAGSLFREVTFGMGCGSKMEAKNSVFDDCHFWKAGGWNAGGSDTRWRFENCAFSKRLMKKSEDFEHVSIRAVDCTFYDLALPAISFRGPPKDDWRYMQGKDMQYDGCRFFNCEIPESALAMTVDCVFDSCQFTIRDQTDWSKSTKPIVVNGFIVPARTKPPKSYTNGQLQVNFQIAAPAQQAGSILAVTRTSAGLNYPAIPAAGRVVLLGGDEPPSAAKTQPQTKEPPAKPATPAPQTPAARLAATAATKYNQSLSAAGQSYSRDLGVALQAAMRGGDLDEANAIKAVIDRIKQGQSPGGQFKSAPAMAAKSRYQQAAAAAAQQYVRDLDIAQKEALGAGDLEQANAINMTRKQLE